MHDLKRKTHCACGLILILSNYEKQEIKKRKRKRKQKGGWLNRCNFAYAGRDAANTGMNAFNRIAPGLMKKASTKIICLPRKNKAVYSTRRKRGLKSCSNNNKKYHRRNT